MQFSDPNANSYGYDSFGNSGMPYMGMGQQRRRAPGRGRLGCLATLLVLFLLGWLASALIGLSLVWGPTVIPVSSHPTLIVESDVYNNSVINKPVLHIHAGGPSGQIIIRPDRLLNIPFGFPERYQESSDHKTVIYDYDLPIDAGGTFDITVPALTDLKVDTNSWGLQVEGVTGQMILTTNSGALTVSNCHLSGPSLLRSNGGAITFQSTLDPGGIAQFDNNSGPITVNLPQSANVHLDAAATNGTITSNISQASVQPSGSGAELHTDLGAAPRAILSLFNNQGTITINEQGGN